MRNVLPASRSTVRTMLSTVVPRGPHANTSVANVKSELMLHSQTIKGRLSMHAAQTPPVHLASAVPPSNTEKVGTSSSRRYAQRTHERHDGLGDAICR